MRAPGRPASSPPLQPPGNLRCAAAPGTGTDVALRPVGSGRKQKDTTNAIDHIIIDTGREEPQEKQD